MKKTRVCLFGVALAAVIFMAWAPGTAAGDKVTGVTDKTIKIGGPMLITGPIAKLGTAAADGLNIYWKWLNDQGGVHGRKVECLLEDDGYNPTRAVAAAKKLIARDKIFAFLTTSGTPQTLQLMPLLDKEKIPALSGIIPSFPGLMKEMPMLFTFGMPYGEQMILAIDYAVKDLKLKNATIGIIYQDDAYGKENIRGIELAAKAYGLKIVAKEAYKRGAVDFSSQALNLKRANPDILMMATVTRETTAFLKETDKLGWYPVCFSTAAVCYEKIIELLGDKARNLHTVNYIARFWEESPGMKQLKAVYKKYRPDIDMLMHYHILGYVNSMIFAQALKGAGRDLTREGWVKAMENIRDFDTQGLAGVISFAPDMHSPKCQGRIFKTDLVKKLWIPVTDYRTPSVR
ncbi:MAG: ABC transporter substrate-binding protein [Deltaproteobacteria bacterium]|nr:ABC transporter substrate-binding protein [Deltaproteobacteria bacterium]